MNVLTREEILMALSDLPGNRWQLSCMQEGGSLSLSCQLRFSGFEQAFAFMTQVALIAARLDHHPNWSNVFDRVAISLSTHDAGGVTDKDLQLAHSIEAVLQLYLPNG